MTAWTRCAVEYDCNEVGVLYQEIIGNGALAVRYARQLDMTFECMVADFTTREGKERINRFFSGSEGQMADMSTNRFQGNSVR